MATVSYGIRTQQKNAETVNIRVRFFNGRKCQLYGKTSYTVPMRAWDAKRETIKDDAQIFSETFTYEYAQHLIDNLSDLKKHILNSFNRSNGAELPTTWLQTVIDQFYKIKAEEAKQSAPELKENLIDYLTRYKKEIKDGTRLTDKNTPFKPDTVRSRNNSVNVILAFMQEKNYSDFEEVTMDFYNEFLHHCNLKQYTPQTTGKHIKVLKQLVNQAREEKLHTNTQTTLKSFKTISAESDTIYLTHKEIEAIEELNLSAPKDAQLDICRDVFLVGVETLQCYSDYHRIGKENVIILPNKTKAVTLRQQKTNAKVVIPCTPRLARILAKYNNELPRTYSQMVNDNIKLICLRAKITQKIEHTSIKGAKRVTEIVPKYTLVTTHTARRTGATLMYLDGMDLLTIMKFTGHETEAEFLKYIRVTAEENAIRLSKMKYFNQTHGKTK